MSKENKHWKTFFKPKISKKSKLLVEKRRPNRSFSAADRYKFLHQDGQAREQWLKSREMEREKEYASVQIGIGTKSEKLIEKKFVKDMNAVLISINQNVKPNSKINFDKYLAFLNLFIFHSEKDQQRIHDNQEVMDLWRFLWGDDLNFVNKHSL